MLLLDIGWYLAIALFATVLGIIAVALVWGRPPGDIAIVVPVQVKLEPAVPFAATSAGAGPAEARGAVVQLALLDPGRALLFPMFDLVVLVLAWLLVVLHQLRRLFRTLRDGRPFTPANIARIRRLGAAVIVGDLGRVAIAAAQSAYAGTAYRAEGFASVVSVRIEFGAIVAGLALLAVAEVFRHGLQLEQDQALTV